jgi:3',5'-cyclic AMP phosphodiesterase CpdA
VRRAAGLALVAVLAGCGSMREPAAPLPAPSTLQGTLVDRDGDGALERGPGEPLHDRGQAAPVGRVLTTFAQITDAHVRDEESPARVPFLDRYGASLRSTFRPQDALSPQVLAAAVRAVNAQRPQAVFVTGDLIDSAQRNELRMATEVLDGGRVDPDSGAPGYRGVQESADPDPFYYRPGVDAPRHPGLLAAAQRPFTSPGLRAPWYATLGNHDVLLAGETPPTADSDRVAVGTRLVTSLDQRTRLPQGVDRGALVRTLLSLTASGRAITVPADPERRSLTAAEVVRAFARGRPTGLPSRLDYTVDLGPRVRAVVLDTIDRAGGDRPIVDPALPAWLRARLREAGDRAVVVVSHQPLPEALLAILDHAPHVVASIAGDTHRNRIAPRSHYWQITTSSLADHPQQARMFRLRETAGGGVAVETWMVDQDHLGLAGISAQLAFLDAQGGRPQGFAGTRLDRNARLFTPPAG